MLSESRDIKSRQTLLHALESKMSGAYNELNERGEQNHNENLVKTYLLEFNKPSGHVQVNPNALENELTIPSYKSDSKPKIPTVEQTEDEGLYIARWVDKKQEATTFYIDTLTDIYSRDDYRFWVAHTMSNASSADRVINALATKATPIDRVWLWPNLLRDIERKGSLRSVNLSYDQTYFDPENKPRQSGKQARVSFKGEALSLWKSLQFSEGLSHDVQGIRDRLVESKVSINYSGQEDHPDNFAIEDINFNGKFTTKGTSAVLHQEIVEFAKKRYRNKVLEIERRHTIGSSSGESLCFVSEGGNFIEDIEFFCSRVFSGGPPFYIWGIPESLPYTGQGKIVNAVDVGTGSKLFFQIYSDIILLGLKSWSCGNSAIKFFINLQQIYGSSVSAETSDGQPIF